MDWVFRTYHDELKAWEVDLLWQAGTHIMGRNLYEEMAAYDGPEAVKVPIIPGWRDRIELRACLTCSRRTRREQGRGAHACFSRFIAD